MAGNSGDNTAGPCMRSTVTCGAVQVNPNSYYDTMGRPGQRGGERERQLATFARNAVLAAEVHTRKPRSQSAECASYTPLLELERVCVHARIWAQNWTAWCLPSGMHQVPRGWLFNGLQLSLTALHGRQWGSICR